MPGQYPVGRRCAQPAASGAGRLEAEHPRGMSSSEGGGSAFTLDSAFKPETIGDVAVEQMVAILDLQGRGAVDRAAARYALAAADIRPGSICVDVGSGTGTMTRRLALHARVGSTPGKALGIEPTRHASRGRRTAGRRLCTHTPSSARAWRLLSCRSRTVSPTSCGAERGAPVCPAHPAAAISPRSHACSGRAGRPRLLDSDHESRVESDMDPNVARALKLALPAPPTRARRATSRRQASAVGPSLDLNIGSSAMASPRRCWRRAACIAWPPTAPSPTGCSTSPPRTQRSRRWAMQLGNDALLRRDRVRVRSAESRRRRAGCGVPTPTCATSLTKTTSSRNKKTGGRRRQ